MSNSNIRLSVVVAIISALIIFATASIANAKPVDPLIPVWNAINNLQQQVNDLYNKTIDLQNQINNIQLIPGPQGAPGISGYEIVANSLHCSPGSTTCDSTIREEPPTVIAYCPEGKQVIGGGGKTDKNWLIYMRSSYPLKEPDGWSVTFAQEFDPIGEFDVYAYAICANVQ